MRYGIDCICEKSKGGFRLKALRICQNACLERMVGMVVQGFGKENSSS